MKILLELGYLGSNYHGWQVQKNAPTVQKTVCEKAEMLLGCPVAVTGCSRTDAGVHAKQFFCTIEGEGFEGFPLDRLPRALNLLLPDDISAKSARRVADDFHPRYSAVGKEYEYLIYTGRERDPFLEGRAWMLPGRNANAEKMDLLSKSLIGTHDFSSFCASGGKVTDKVRTVFDCTVKKEGDLIRLTVSANGFLYNMVRIIAGTLYDLSTPPKKGEDREKSDLAAILEKRDRAFAGQTAPPEGLYLNRVFY